jgi:hypothetical protein
MVEKLKVEKVEIVETGEAVDKNSPVTNGHYDPLYNIKEGIDQIRRIQILERSTLQELKMSGGPALVYAAFK